MAKTPRKKSTTTENNDVEAYMKKLKHPLKDEIEAIRKIIKGTDDKIEERIKWNAPSYYYKEDLVTFNHRAEQHVHLVFHHPAITTIKSHLLEGDYKDRRMSYFRSMSEIKSNKQELEKVIAKLIEEVDKKLSKNS